MGSPILGGDRVLVTTATTGTSAYVLGDALAETFRTPAQEGIPAGARVMYTVQDSLDAPTLFERGEGIYAPGPPATITRAQIKAGSNGTAAVNWSAGPKYLFLSLHADRAAIRDTDGRIPPAQMALGRLSQLRADAGVAIPNAENAVMTFNVRGTDTLGVIGAGTGPFGSFTIQEAGLYLVALTMSFANTAGGGQRYGAILLNGGAIAANRAGSATGDADISTLQLASLAPGDTLQAQLFQDSGAPLVAGGNPRSLFSVAKIGG